MKKLVSLLSAAVLGCVGLPAWSQQAPAPPLPAAPTAAVENLVPPPEAGDGLHGTWSVGGGLYGLVPVFQSNPAFIIARTTSTSGFINQVDFNQRIEAAPLAWVGYTFDSGWGVRARWFEFDSDSSITDKGFTNKALTSQSIFLPGGQLLITTGTSSPNITSAVMAASENLSINVIDGEATNAFTWCHWAMLASAGVRYGTIDQSYNFEVSTPATTKAPKVAAAQYTASSSNNFTGVGPTLGLEARHQVSSSDLYFYSSARGSLLFGSEQEQGTVPYTPTAPGNPVALQFLSNGQAALLGIGEMEVGAEIEHCWGRFHFSAQLALVGQMWWGAGNSTSVQSLDANPATAITAIHGAIPAGGNLGFVGGVGRFGISF